MEEEQVVHSGLKQEVMTSPWLRGWREEMCKPDPSEPWNCGGRVAVRRSGHSCHYRKPNGSGRNIPASSPTNHLLRLSVGQPCSEGGQQESPGRKAGGKGSMSRTVDLWVTKELALLVSKELSYYTNPLQYSCLEYSRDMGAGQAVILWGHKELDTTEQLTLNTYASYPSW